MISYHNISKIINILIDKYSTYFIYKIYNEINIWFENKIQDFISSIILFYFYYQEYNLYLANLKIFQDLKEKFESTTGFNLMFLAINNLSLGLIITYFYSNTDFIVLLSIIFYSSSTFCFTLLLGNYVLNSSNFCLNYPVLYRIISIILLIILALSIIIFLSSILLLLKFLFKNSLNTILNFFNGKSDSKGSSSNSNDLGSPGT
jgi:hypothetical protein